MEIDLHGYTHQKAEHLILNIFDFHKDTVIRFITGHSQQMKNIVKSLADEYNFKTESLIDTEIIVWIDA